MGGGSRRGTKKAPRVSAALPCQESEFFIDDLLVRIHFIIVMIRWTGLAPWEFEFPITYQSLQVGAWSGVAASAGEAVEALHRGRVLH